MRLFIEQDYDTLCDAVAKYLIDRIMDAKAAGATIPDLDKPEPKPATAKKGKKSSGGSKKRKSEAISEEEPAAEAAGGDDAMDMTAVNKLTADKLKKELKKRKLDDKGKKAELKARLVEALGL